MAIPNLPEITVGDDLGRTIAGLFDFRARDVLVVAQKIVSKSENRTVRLDSVVVGSKAKELASQADKDPRLMQLILNESNEVLRVASGVVVVEDNRGWVCANAGIDRSNVIQEDATDTVLLLPIDPDGSADRLRVGIMDHSGVEIGVVICDSHGRAWREGTVGVAIGSSGITALSDRRGQYDRQGYPLQHTIVGTADEIAAAASLLMGQGSEGLPAVVIRGLNLQGGGKARDLQRPRERDLFR
jgi:coenzyme F420-0:L-glutamate ligase / coenzyme F420-1:gamma-L-glutamate ligase